MMVRKPSDCKEIIAGDNSRLRELLHPDRDYQFSGRYSLALAIVAAGETTLAHRMRTSEVYYIQSGVGVLYVDDKSTPVAPGDTIEIPPGAVQRIENTGREDLVFLCIVDPAWRADDEEILD